jgi:hypothetical protein
MCKQTTPVSIEELAQQDQALVLITERRVLAVLLQNTLQQDNHAVI